MQMTINQTIRLTVTFGVISVALFIYFYTAQKNFIKNHKEFILTSTALQWEQSNLADNILQSSLKTYFNQDIIAKNVENLKKTFNKLQHSKILQDKNYKTIKLNLAMVGEQLDSELLDIDRYEMLNAGIKNSLLFLNRHLKNNTFKSRKNQTIYFDALKVLKLLQDTKNTLDLDNIRGEILQLAIPSKDEKITRFIKPFNAHALYLEKNLPLFISITNQITKNNISIKMTDLNTLFSAIALNDFKAFDRYSFIVLILLSISFSLIIMFFSKYVHERDQLTQAKRSLEDALVHDELTGISNRKSFEMEILKYKKPTILLINIVGFKNINDLYGIESGNKLLQQFAHFLSIHIELDAQEQLFRLGSDEFCIISAKKAKKEIISFAQNLDALISAHPFNIHTAQINIQVKIAINNIKPYLENADLTLKVLKEDYSKSVLYHKKEFKLKKNISDALQTIDLIKSAITQDSVIPYFQPIVNIETRKIYKYEALIRIQCLDGTILQPYQFLELSKKSSYYSKLTKIMIQKTLATARRFPKYRFSINFSMLDIANEEFLKDVFKEFDKDRDTSSRIDIELLESEELLHKEKIARFIKNVNAYGMKILIDDFGTGYSNFSYFSEFNIDFLKIDGSITKEITTDAKKLHILKSIYQFSKGMGIDNIAEFVENEEILNVLKEVGIKYAQGYYFSKPLPRPLESDEIKG